MAVLYHLTFVLHWIPTQCARCRGPFDGFGFWACAKPPIDVRDGKRKPIALVLVVVPAMKLPDFTVIPGLWLIAGVGQIVCPLIQQCRERGAAHEHTGLGKILRQQDTDARKHHQ